MSPAPGSLLVQFVRQSRASLDLLSHFGARLGAKWAPESNSNYCLILAPFFCLFASHLDTVGRCLGKASFGAGPVPDPVVLVLHPGHTCIVLTEAIKNVTKGFALTK
jgi:hypothetical protein